MEIDLSPGHSLLDRDQVLHSLLDRADATTPSFRPMFIAAKAVRGAARDGLLQRLLLVAGAFRPMSTVAKQLDE